MRSLQNNTGDQRSVPTRAQGTTNGDSTAIRKLVRIIDYNRVLARFQHEKNIIKMPTARDLVNLER